MGPDTLDDPQGIRAAEPRHPEVQENEVIAVINEAQYGIDPIENEVNAIIFLL